MSGTNPYAQLAADAINALSPYEPGMPPEALEREYGVRDAIKLASNENPLPLPESVQRAVAASVDELSRYPDGGGFALRAALASHLGVSADQLLLGNGSNDVLVLLAETFLTPAVTAVYDQYAFVVYRLAVQATGAKALVAPSNPVDHEQPLGHDLDAMCALIDDTTRMVFIANPNNPTGTWVEGDSLRKFLRSVPAKVIVVLDEAYYEYARGETYPETLSWLEEFPNLVIVRTFSKVYGLAALRVGYGVAAAGIAELLNRVRQPFNVNSIAQAAAVAALAEQSWVEQCHTENQQGRDKLVSRLAELGVACLPTRANFVLAHFGPAAMACNEFLLRRGVIVRPVANYGLPDYLRITVGTDAEMERLLAAVTAWCDEQK